MDVLDDIPMLVRSLIKRGIRYCIEKDNGVRATYRKHSK